MTRSRIQVIIAAGTLLAIAMHLFIRLVLANSAPVATAPLIIVYLIGGLPLLRNILSDVLHGKLNTDLLAGVSIIASLLLGEYLAGCVVILMLSGGEALESYAFGRAASVLAALANRIPSHAHNKLPD